jgi:nicotinamide mononucleotide transporter
MNFIETLINHFKDTTLLEYVAVVFGIASVWFSKKENILVYPVGLINTITYIYLSFKGYLFGEATVNLYYTIVSIYGWIIWAKKDRDLRPVVHITFSDRNEWIRQLLFFSAFFVGFLLALIYLRQQFAEGVLPLPDAFASATAFTGMWLMAKKKVESWYWWIATNITSIPLFFVKGYVVTSLYYIVLLLLAFSGLMEWRKKANAKI